MLAIVYCRATILELTAVHVMKPLNHVLTVCGWGRGGRERGRGREGEGGKEGGGEREGERGRGVQSCFYFH